MACNKMGNGVRGFPAFMAGGVGGRNERFGGEGESLWCDSLCKMKFVFPCANVIAIKVLPSKFIMEDIVALVT